MFAKGREPGFGAKANALKIHPYAVCRKKTTICDITGYLVTDSRTGELISSGWSALEAWEKAELVPPNIDL